MTTMLEYLEAEFGPSTHGEPGQTYHSFSHVADTETEVVEAILADIKHRSLGGVMILGSASLLDADDKMHGDVLVTFSRGMAA